MLLHSYFNTFAVETLLKCEHNYVMRIEHEKHLLVDSFILWLYTLLWLHCYT